MKTCTTCKVDFPIEDFPIKRVKGQESPRSQCRACYNDYYRQWYQNNKEAHKTRVNRSRPKARAQKYGLTIEAMHELLSSNGGLCHLCNIRSSKVIDHDHQTMKVRGALCTSCNTSIGKLGDTIEGLMRAIEYLQRAPEA